MDKLKKLLKVLLYLSFGFIIYYLYTFDYLQFSNVHFNLALLFTSLILLWSGFVVSTLSWKNSLHSHQIQITNQLAIYSHGISVFAKYIPGKVWVILGRASIVSEHKSSLTVLSAISLKEQLVYLLTGLIVSLFAIVWLPLHPLFSVFVGLTACALALFLFSKKIHWLILVTIKKLFKKDLDIPYVSIREALPMLKSILGYWFFWSVGFYILVLATYPNAPGIIAFAFPISVCYGLLAVIVPGGIGVRESIIVLFLTSAGMETSFAVTISLLQRLWFITGEIFIFGLALIMKNKIQDCEN
ncbi:lysylphosphatidylglycerol synthase domain-containing protein [Prolixibacteraceae bacterium Z1-6]|uniref:Lysylphosphatidylglycerol synthase domain-containing protein n=1 Tax=Draconibacterium aestuarii TaxID=2998507 RepID=A0A9X3F4M1_9BACT|nr:lysylphosphatidylglycerol synthase domain-containing protein [Prolixibacteraceae bacterium Z1-6]